MLSRLVGHPVVRPCSGMFERTILYRSPPPPCQETTNWRSPWARATRSHDRLPLELLAGCHDNNIEPTLTATGDSPRSLHANRSFFMLNTVLT